jgi:hypothetical protein
MTFPVIRGYQFAVLVGLMLSVGGSVPPTTARGGTDSSAKTYIFRGAKQMGNVSAVKPHTYWIIDCAAYDGASVALRSARIEIDSILLDEWGYGTRVRNGEWVFYRFFSQVAGSRGVGKKLGVATRRSATRWDVQRGKNKSYGHTSGPDGPEAAAALLVVCSP